MSEVNVIPCTCPTCPGSGCTCGCQGAAEKTPCACGPNCACGDACQCANGAVGATHQKGTAAHCYMGGVEL